MNVSQSQQVDDPAEPNDVTATTALDMDGAREGEDHEEGNVPVVQNVDMEAEFAEVPNSSAVHFFVDADPVDPSAADEVVGVEEAADTVGSITQFLTLPTVSARVSTRSRDPIMNFSKFIMLMSEQYIEAAAKLKDAKAKAARQKEQTRVEKEERRKREEIEREEA